MPLFSRLRRHLPLIALFLIALPLFVWLRWEPGPQLTRRLAAYGLSERVSFAAVEKSFPGLRIAGVAVLLPNGGRLNCDEILLRPALATLLTGTPALSFQAGALGWTARGVLAAAGEALALTDVALHADVQRLAALPAPLHGLGLAGELQANGEARLRRRDGLPLAGSVLAVWRGAASKMLPALSFQELRLHLAAAAADRTPPAWQWQLASKPQGVAGKGVLVMAGASPEAWRLRGKLDLDVGGVRNVLTLAGTLTAPRWRPARP